MTDELKFAVSLEDRISGAAKHAADSLRAMSGALGDAKSKLAFYQQQLSKANEMGDIAGHRHFSALVGQQKQHLYGLSNQLGPQADLDKAAAAWDKYGKAAQKAGEPLFRVVEPAEVARHAVEGLGRGLSEMANAIKAADVGGAIRGATEALAGMASTLDLIVPGLGQLASGAIKAAGGFVAMTADIIEAGVELSLEVSATNNKLRATFDALGAQGPEAGQKTLDMLNKLSSTLPQSREKLADYARTFEALGITDLGQLQYQIRATASAQAIAGDTGAEAYEHISRKIRLAVEAHQGLKLGERPLEQLYKAGTNVSDVAGRMGLTVKQLRQQLESGSTDAQKFGDALSESLIAKGKGPLDATSSSFDTLKSKGFEVFSHLFDGVDVTPLTDAIKMVTSLGDQGEPSGAALKSGITGGMNGIIKALGNATIEATAFFLHLEAGVIRFETKMHPVVSAFEKISAVIAKIEKLLGNTFASSVPDALKPVVGSAFDIIRGYRRNPGTTDAWKGRQLNPETGLPNYANMNAMGVPTSIARPEPARVDGPNRVQIAKAVQLAVRASGGAQVHNHIGNVSVNITAPNGVTDAQSMSVTGLGAGLERVQLMGGR